MELTRRCEGPSEAEAGSGGRRCSLASNYFSALGEKAREQVNMCFGVMCGRRRESGERVCTPEAPRRVPWCLVGTVRHPMSEPRQPLAMGAEG